jgi:16S rRNA processing protein RimM
MNRLPPVDLPDRQDQITGSSLPGEPVFIVVGRLRRSHGVQGEIAMEVLTDFPDRLRPNTTIYLGERHLPMRIKKKRWKDQLLLLAFDGYDTCEHVNELRNQLVYIKSDAVPPLPEGEYYYHQLFGLHVKDEAGKELGVLTEILETGANDVYVVRSPDGHEILLPAIAPVILRVDLENSEIIARPPEWY